MLDDGFKIGGLDKTGKLYGESGFVIKECGESLYQEC